MKLTVIVSETGAACNIGGPVTHRRITVDLTTEQAAALALHDRWDAYGTTFLELDPPDRVCSCPIGSMERESGVPMRDSDLKCVRCGKEPAPAPAPAASRSDSSQRAGDAGGRAETKHAEALCEPMASDPVSRVEQGRGAAGASERERGAVPVRAHNVSEEG